MKLILLLIAATTFVAVLPSPSEALEIYNSIEPEGYAYLILNGVIETPTDNRAIQKFLTAQAKAKRPTVIYLTSPGGALELVPQLASSILAPSALLKAKSGRRNLLVINEDCSSACMALSARLTNLQTPKSLDFVVTTDAEFGVHSPRILLDGQVVEIQDPIEREERIQLQVQALRDAGVSAKWLQTNNAAFRSPKLTVFKASELCGNGSQVIPKRSCVAPEAETSTVDAKLQQILKIKGK